MGSPWIDESEPRLSEMMDDPIVRKQMASDGITRDDLYRNIETVRQALLDWRKARGEGAFPFH